MRIAALYDIHGNLPALEAVLEEIDASGVEEIVVGGDVVPGPMARECLERLLALTVPTQFIAGNCEREMLALHAGATSSLPKEVQATCRWTAEQLGDSALRTIGRWPPTLRLNHGSLGDTLFCHATPRSDSEIFTRLAPDEELQRIFGGVNAAIVVCGHTHVQFERRLDDMTILNAGSVG